MLTLETLDCNVIQHVIQGGIHIGSAPELLYLAPTVPAEWFMLVVLRQYTLHIFSDMFESTNNEEDKLYSR